MIDPSYLIYFPDPYGVGKSKYFVITKSGISDLPGSSLAHHASLVTFDVHTLVDDLRTNGGSLPSKLIDITDALRLYAGMSRADGGEKRWNFWKNIKGDFGNQEAWKDLHRISSSYEAVPDGDRLNKLVTEFSKAVDVFWKKIVKNLRQAGEFDRFFEIEVPAAQIFYHRQFLGIPINRQRVDEFTSLASKERYSSYQAVSSVLNISATGLSYWNVGSRLPLTDLGLPSADVTGYALRDQMKLASQRSRFAQEFTKYLDASRDMDILARLSGASDRVFPTFHPVGTISSRILIADPYIQELRRRYRAVVDAEPGLVLRYFDYSQFEPGVMASLSGDVDLVVMYNDGDVYTALSLAVFGDHEHRQLCKRVFLAFSYGMSIDAIALLLCGKGSGSTEIQDMKRKIAQFFDRFKVLTRFKAGLEERLMRDGKIETLHGNFRRRLGSGPLSPKERRWAVSQVIQGTASLIFKCALIEIQRVFGTNSLLVPVHDAILMQLPEDDAEENQRQIRELMQASFRRYCPDVNVRVTCGAFHE
ncbi:DNA polymerase [Methylobacterium sp. 391_Methyba4]|uniref:DNA polymerase n=1 Tax=Methylobacterium sp. 391_Methyba4 TaxID=3038924 RepID=UPI00241DC777|nr:DNA polymerase [Methylobacterium sp. 391_Methyba4]WFS10637.1 DNA polymerase [Methylobacterium sp. 391_Methyba4]